MFVIVILLRKTRIVCLIKCKWFSAQAALLVSSFIYVTNRDRNDMTRYKCQCTCFVANVCTMQMGFRDGNCLVLPYRFAINNKYLTSFAVLFPRCCPIYGGVINLLIPLFMNTLRMAITLSLWAWWVEMTRSVSWDQKSWSSSYSKYQMREENMRTLSFAIQLILLLLSVKV